MNALVQMLPQDLLDEIKNKIIELFDKTLQEQASVFTDKLSGQISDSMKLIFQGPAVQKEATLMFNSHIFPVYDRIMKDHVTILQAVQKENGELRAEVDKLTQELAAAGNDDGKRQSILSQFKNNITNLFKSSENNQTPKTQGGDPDSTTNSINSFKYAGDKQTESYIGQNQKSADMMASVMSNTNSALNEFGGAIKEQEVVAAKADAHRIKQGHFGNKSCNSIQGGAKKRNKTNKTKSKISRRRKSRRV